MAMYFTDDFVSDCGEDSSEEAEEAEQSSERPLSDSRGQALRQKLQRKYQQYLETELLGEYRRVFQMRLDKKFEGEELQRVQEVLQNAEVLLLSPGDKNNDKFKEVVAALRGFTDEITTFTSVFLPIETILALPVDLLLFFVSSRK